jgi:hypothetical protein
MTHSKKHLAEARLANAARRDAEYTEQESLMLHALTTAARAGNAELAIEAITAAHRTAQRIGLKELRFSAFREDHKYAEFLKGMQWAVLATAPENKEKERIRPPLKFLFGPAPAPKPRTSSPFAALAALKQA